MSAMMFDSPEDSAWSGSRYTSAKSLFNILVEWVLDRTTIGSQERAKRELEGGGGFEVVLTEVQAKTWETVPSIDHSYNAIMLQWYVLVEFNIHFTVKSKIYQRHFFLHSSCICISLHVIPLRHEAHSTFRNLQQIFVVCIGLWISMNSSGVQAMCVYM